MKINVINGKERRETHINPRAVIEAYELDDGRTMVMLNGFDSVWGQYTNEAYSLPNTYEIDRESYRRIVSWLDAMVG